MRVWLRRIALTILWIFIGIFAIAVAGLFMGIIGPAVLTLCIAVVVGGMLVPIALALIGPAGRIPKNPANQDRKIMNARPTGEVSRLNVGLAVAASVAALAVGGVIAVPAVYGTYPRFSTMVAEVPDRISGTVHGLWDSQVLDQDVASLTKQLDGRELQYLNLKSTSSQLGVIAGADDMILEDYNFEGGSIAKTSEGSRSHADPLSFTMADVNISVIRDAAAAVYKKDPSAHVEMVKIESFGDAFTMTFVVKNPLNSYETVFDPRTGEQLN